MAILSTAVNQSKITRLGDLILQRIEQFYVPSLFMHFHTSYVLSDALINMARQPYHAYL